MKLKRILVNTPASLLKFVEQHGGGNGIPLADVPNDIKNEDIFICRWGCKDGTMIDFIASDAQVAENFPPAITGNSDKIMGKYFKELSELAGDSNPFISFIKGEAYVESMLVNLIESAILDSKALELDRMTFTKKVNLCEAIGLIHSNVSPVLKKFANIRNKFAHQVWPDFSEKEFQDFLNVFRQSKHLKDHLIIQQDKALTILDCVWAMWIYLLEQLFRVHSKRELLKNFWESVVDAEPVDNPDFNLPIKPLVISKGKND